MGQLGEREMGDARFESGPGGVEPRERLPEFRLGLDQVPRGGGDPSEGPPGDGL
jgi:hypothetical protein